MKGGRAPVAQVAKPAARILRLPPGFSLSPLAERGERVGERTPRHFDALCAPELGKDAFHRVPDFALNEWDAVERVLTILEDRVGVREKAISD